MLRKALSGAVILALGLTASSLSWAQGAPAAPPEGDLDTWLNTQRDAAGRACERRGIELVEDRFLVACGEAGLWTVRREGSGFVLVRADDLGGPVMGLFVRNGRVWAETVRSEARPVTFGPSDAASARSFPVEHPAPPLPVPPSGSPAPSVAKPAQPTPVPVAQHEGRVTKVLLGEVVIDLGAYDGLVNGTRIELSVVDSEDLGPERAVRRSVVAVGTVTAVSRGYSRVKLGIGERVPVGARARTTDEEVTAARAGPPRMGGLWELGFMARPFLALGDFGGGLLLDASAGYRFPGPLHVVAAFEPFAWASGKGVDRPSVTPVSAFIKASYDLPLFEVGFGLGVETVFDTEALVPAGSGTLFVQQARIGAAEGLHLDAVNHVVLFHSEFAFSGFVGRLQIPVGETSWLQFRGGGGSAGYGYGETGVRVLLRGNGDKGSVYFTGSLGGAIVYKRITLTCGGPDFIFDCSNTVSYSGPMVGAGAEYRM